MPAAAGRGQMRALSGIFEAGSTFSEIFATRYYDHLDRLIIIGRHADGCRRGRILVDALLATVVFMIDGDLVLHGCITRLLSIRSTHFAAIVTLMLAVFLATRIMAPSPAINISYSIDAVPRVFHSLLFIILRTVTMSDRFVIIVLRVWSA